MFKGKVQLGLQVLNAIAVETKNDKKITVAQIADITGKSDSFVEQIVSILRCEGLIIGVRGPGGGYLLAKDEDSNYYYLSVSIIQLYESFYPEDEDQTFLSNDFITTKLSKLLV